MKYFLDTEFIEHAGGIQLVSIGIVCEDGREFYAESSEINPLLANNWVRKNVLGKLIYWGKWGHDQNEDSKFVGFQEKGILGFYANEELIATSIRSFFYEKDGDKGSNIEIYAYFADYDWVVFCRLFGRMINLPKGFPMWCIDLKQMMWERELTKEWKQFYVPDPEDEHNALVDARWNKALHQEIMKHKP